MISKHKNLNRKCNNLFDTKKRESQKVELGTMLTNLIEDNERPLSVIRETDSRNHNRESTKNQEVKTSNILLQFYRVSFEKKSKYYLTKLCQ